MVERSKIDKLDEWIVHNPAILGGTPCIRGTRLNVYTIAARYRGGETADQLAAENPPVTPDMILAAVAFAERHPQIEHPDGRPWRKAARNRRHATAAG